MSPRFTVVGLGPGPGHALTVEALEALRDHTTIDLSVEEYPAVAWLRSPAGASLAGHHDWRLCLPLANDASQHLADTIVARLHAGDDVCYAVPGNPLADDASVPLVLEQARRAGYACRVVAGIPLIAPVLAALALTAADGLQVTTASKLTDTLTQPGFPSPEAATVIFPFDKGTAAGSAFRQLRRLYPTDHPVRIVTRASASEAWTVFACPLSDVDEAVRATTSVALYLPPIETLAVMDSLRTLEYVTMRLRAPDGCPWDRAQTHDSIQRNLLEETYELLEAFEEGNPEKCREELGDLLMQVALHAEMGREAGEYDLGSITRGINEKLIRRHPHVFGDVKVGGVADVLKNWDAIKQREGKHHRSSLAGIPAAMPALAYAQGIQERAALAGFAWPDVQGAWAKLDEELAELREARTPDDITMELGDVLFVLSNLARYLDIQAEEALRIAVRRFRDRFEAVEAIARERDVNLRDLPADALLGLWKDAKARVGV